MATIITKNSSTASSVPTNAQLVQGELAVNVTDKRLFTENASGTVVELGTNPSSLTLPNGTANGLAFLNASKVLTTGSALVFDGSNLGLGVTPSAWSLRAFQIGSCSLSVAGSSNTQLLTSANSYYDGTNFKYVASDYATYYRQTSGQHQWYTAPSGTAGNAISFTQAMTLDASGRLGVGTTGPAYKLDVYTDNSSDALRLMRNNVVATDVGPNLDFSVTQTNAQSARLAVVGAQFKSSWGGDLVFYTKPANGNPDTAVSERARIDSSGNLLVGTTTGIYSVRTVISATGFSAAVLTTDTSAEYGPIVWNKGTSGNNGFVLFQTEASATTRGSITYNRGGGLVAYNVTSDYRAKTVNGPVKNALAKVAALKPSTGRMNGAEFDIDFFVAHELQEVIPSAVTGEKDAVNEDGTPNYQMVDKSALIPLLTAAIQEQQAIINAQAAALEQLKADVAALKAAA